MVIYYFYKTYKFITADALTMFYAKASAVTILTLRHDNFELPDQQIYGLVQERHNSSALAMELHLSCTNPSKYQGFMPGSSH